MSQFVPIRYKVLCIIDKRCRVRIYVGGEVVYIHVAQGSGLCSCHDNTKSVQCIRVATTTREVSAVILPATAYIIKSTESR